jgi:hypothetical protein
MTAPEFDQALLDKLFPAPSFSSAFSSPSAPTPNAGITPESTAALQRLLKENHQRFHVFFNEKASPYLFFRTRQDIYVVT